MAPMVMQLDLFFCPGEKVESIAYIPLLLLLSDLEITCVLVDMSGNLVVLNINAADDIFDLLSNIEECYLSGRSLGGAMASSYVEDHFELFKGLILLGNYPVNDAPLDALLIYGTHDVKLDLNKVQKADVVFEILDGNHAYFW